MNFSLEDMPNNKNLRIGFFQTLPNEKEYELLFKILPALAENNIQSVIVLPNNISTEIFDIEKKYPKHITLLENNKEIPNKLWKTIHTALFLSNPNKEEKENCIEHKVVPIIPKNCGFENFSAVEEIGNAFTYTENNFWQLISALFRASTNFQFSYDWSTLKQNLKKTK